MERDPQNSMAESKNGQRFHEALARDSPRINSLGWGMLHALSLAELEDDDDEDEERWAFRLRTSVAAGGQWFFGHFDVTPEVSSMVWALMSTP